jgi:hypothetical protein
LSLNFGLIIGYFVRDNAGQWAEQIPSNHPKTIPAQLWVCLALGSTVLRGYAMATHDAREPSPNPIAHEYQQGLKPGEPAYYAMLSSAKAIKEYTRHILGAEQLVPDVGPDFVCGHRLGPAGRIWWAVNLSERERVVAAPELAWTKAETLDEAGLRTVAEVTHRTVPSNGVLILTA